MPQPTNADRMPPLPPGVAEALAAASRQPPPQQQGPLIVTDSPLPVHPNEVNIEANPNEVILSFMLTTGGNPQSPPQTQTVAKLCISWQMLEVLNSSSGKLLVEALSMRQQTLTAQLAGVIEAHKHWEGLAVEQAPTEEKSPKTVEEGVLD